MPTQLVLVHGGEVIAKRCPVPVWHSDRRAGTAEGACCGDESLKWSGVTGSLADLHDHDDESGGRRCLGRLIRPSLLCGDAGSNGGCGQGQCARGASVAS